MQWQAKKDLESKATELEAEKKAEAEKVEALEKEIKQLKEKASETAKEE